MRIKQSEVYDKVLVTEFASFWPHGEPWRIFDIFALLKTHFKKKKSHHISRLTIGYLWEEYEKFWFLSCATTGSVLVDIPS